VLFDQILRVTSETELTRKSTSTFSLSSQPDLNAQYLIEKHVRAVPFLTRHPVATLATGYHPGGRGRVLTSVER